MKQTYDNYYKNYYQTPSGKAAKERANKKYRYKIKAQYGTSSQYKAAQLHKLHLKENQMPKLGAKNVSEKEFKTIKSLLKLNIAQKQVAEIVGRSATLVGLVRQARNFNDYKEMIQARNGSRSSTVQVKPVPKTVDTDHAALIVALNDNSQALKDLAIAWNGLSEKMDEVLETKRPWMSKVRG